MAGRREQPAGYLPTLDGWRAIAALAVIACHTPGAWAYGLKELGGYAVSVFFGLSGLLICTRLLAEHDRAGHIDLVGFYVRRAFRILPPVLAYLGVVAILGAVGAAVVSPQELWACVGFYRNYVTGEHWVTGHFWSLAVEEHFYLFVPALLAWLGPRRVLPVAIGLALPLAAWHMADDIWVGVSARTGLAPAHFRTDCRLPDLLFGCAVALLAGRTPRPAVQVFGGIGGMLLAARIGGLPVPHLFVSMLIPWMLLATVQTPSTRLGRLLEWAPLRWLGRMSYSLYLWQQLFFYGPAANRLSALEPLQTWPWNILAVLACAASSHALLEEPLTRLGRTLARRRRPSVVKQTADLFVTDRRAWPAPSVPRPQRRPASTGPNRSR